VEISCPYSISRACWEEPAWPADISIDAGSRIDEPDGVPEILRNHLQGAYQYAGETWYQASYEGVFGSLAQRTAE
jgi:hypothetical protein